MNIRNCTRFRKEVNNVPPRERTTVLTTTMTTVGLPNTSAYTAKQLASCLVVSSACAYGSKVRFSSAPHPPRRS